MKVAVTGAGGFVGQHLTRRLLDAGHGVVAIDRKLGDIARAPGVQPVETDLSDPAELRRVFDGSIGHVVHLAVVPGGAAEADPAASRRVNIDATLDLIDAAAGQGNCPRFVFTSTIAVLGEPLPRAGVDDMTPLRPRLIYGMHKAMIETALATLTRRGAIDGVVVRLPGIVARPRATSGMKSAFMSDIFHAIRGGEDYVLPVSAEAQLWLMSLRRCTANLYHALEVDGATLPESRAMTLPAIRISVAELTKAIGAASNSEARLCYDPDPALEAAFGTHPPLDAAAAKAAGFADDGSVDALVTSALAEIGKD